MNMRNFNCTAQFAERTVKGQAMTEFVLASFVALIVLFAAIQMAALGREYMDLGELNYQVTRWATNLGNNSIVGKNSPQCTDVVNLIKNVSAAPYSSPPTSAPVATGYMGKVASNGVTCGAPPTGGMGVAMACLTAGGNTVTSCATQRPTGTAVQVTLTMDTTSVLFLNLDRSGTKPNFLGIPFPRTLSSTQTMLTQ